MSSEETTHSLPPVIDEVPGLPPDDGDDEWAVRGPAKGIRLAVPMALLIGVLLVAAGFWGGATLQKRSGGSGSGNASLASAFAARLRGAGATGATGATAAAGATGAAGAAGFAGFGGSSAAAVGTVSVVDGSTLYVLSSTGSLVKVTLGPSTTITRNAKAPASGLRPGDTVIVQGSTAGNGNVAASSVSATAPGVSAGGGGFGGGRFGGAGRGAASSG